MTEMLSLKLAAELKRRLDRAARQRGLTKSGFARQAIEQAIARSESAPAGLDLVRDLVGKYDLEGQHRSEADPGETIRDKVRRDRGRDARRDR